MTQRRKFLEKSLKYVSFAYLSESLLACTHLVPKSSKSQGIILCPSSQSKMSLYGPGHTSEEGEVIGYDIDKDKRFVIDVPLGLSHSLIRSPTDEAQSILLEITGDYGCFVNLKQFKAGSRFYADTGFVFSGHGIYSPDAKFVYTCEQNIKDPNINFIVRRNSRDLSIHSKIDTKGVRVHQVMFLSDKSTMIATHYGNRPEYTVQELGATLAFVDTKTDQVLNVIKSGQPDRAMCHVALNQYDQPYILTGREKRLRGAEFDKNREISLNPKKLREIGWASAGDTARLTSPVAFLKNRNSALDLLGHERETLLFKNALSIQLFEKKNVLAITHPEDRLITFWKMSDNSFIKKVETKSVPTGITLSKCETYFISWCGDGVLYFFDTNKLSLSRSVDIGMEHAKSFHNAHIYTI